MDLSAGDLAVLATVVFAGGLAQGTIGMGVGILVAPVLSIVEPSAVPATIIFLALPLTVIMSIRERAHIDVRGFWLMTIGRVPGVVGGVLLVVALSGSAITIMSGTVILVAVALSVVNAAPRPTDTNVFIAGSASGLMGTAAGVGGPPLGLVYQTREPAVVRSTLAISFMVGTVVSLVGLGIAGELAWWKLEWAGLLLVPLLAGLGTSFVLTARLHTRWFRPTVLAFAAVAGIAAVFRGLS